MMIVGGIIMAHSTSGPMGDRSTTKVVGCYSPRELLLTNQWPWADDAHHATHVHESG